MEWRKVKSLIILILLLVNGFLLVLVGIRGRESAQYERSALKQTIQVLAQGGIQVDPSAVTAADGLAPITVERDLEREARLARALLGEEIQADNRGGGLYLYQGALGEVTIRAGGELSAVLADDAHWEASHPESHAASLLKKLGVEGEQSGIIEENGETSVRFIQNWDGVPVFSCQVEFVYRDGRLRTLSGTLLMASGGTAEAGSVLTLPTALMRFSEAVGATGDVCSAIRSMRAGCRTASQSLSGGIRLTPVWLVSTDTADYYLDGVTGGLTRLDDQGK